MNLTNIGAGFAEQIQTVLRAAYSIYAYCGAVKVVV
jgi:hypothetical protein